MTHAAVSAWWRWTEPSPFITDAEQRRRAKLLLTILLPLTALTLVSTVTTPLVGTTGGLVTPASAVGAIATVVLAAAFFLSRTRWYEQAAVVAVGMAAVGAWQAYFANRYLPGGELILAFLAVSLVLSSLLLPPMFTVSLTGLHAVGIAALPVLYDPSLRDAASVMGIFVVMVGVLVTVHDAVRRRDARARKAAEEALRESEGRFRLAFEAAAVGRVIMSPDGRYLKVNDAMCSILGHKREDLLALGSTSLTFPEDRAATEEARERLLRGDIGHWDLETRYRHKHGQLLWVRTVVSAVRDADGAPLYLVGDVQDVTARKTVEEARLLALERLSEIARLKAVNDFKTQLLNTASHELNTPISALKLQLYLLRRRELDEAGKKRAVDVLDRNVERLALLVRDVLDVARLESGQLRLRPVDADLRALVREALEPYHEASKAQGVELVVEADAEVPLRADAQRVTQVVVNLVSNALKFTPAGGRIRLTARRDADHAVITVEDSGAGLTPDQMARLFQPFSQVHDTMQQTRAGTGLGLHICKGIVEQHGGRIRVESEGPGKGSTFTFTLPLAGPPPQAQDENIA